MFFTFCHVCNIFLISKSSTAWALKCIVDVPSVRKLYSQNSYAKIQLTYSIRIVLYERLSLTLATHRRLTFCSQSKSSIVEQYFLSSCQTKKPNFYYSFSFFNFNDNFNNQLLPNVNFNIQLLPNVKV